MSDFSEICPLFNTGVFNEVIFPNVPMTNVTTCGNALVGTLTFTKVGNFTFGRTVVVTGAFIRNQVKPTIASTVVLRLLHFTSQLAAGTEFATLFISITASGAEVYTWQPMTFAADTTFTSNDILGFTVLTGTASGGGTYDLIVRYKEK